MLTADALARFFAWMKENGRSPETIRTYNSRLHYFAEDYPELPLDTRSIETFLRIRKETPKHRGRLFRVVQAFYSYLREHEGITSPVPSTGKIGRPPKRYREISSQPETVSDNLMPSHRKLAQGGPSVSSSTSLSTEKMLQRFLLDRKNAGLKPNSLASYRTFLQPFARRFVTVPLEYTPIGEFVGALQVCQRTRSDFQLNIKVFYHWLEAKGYIPKDLFTWSRVQPGKARRRILEPEELKRVLAACHSFQDKCLIFTLLDTMARATEVLSMTRENLWPDHALVEGKTGPREVSLTPETYTMLCRLAERGRIFKVDRRPMNRFQLYDIVHHLMLDAGLTGTKLGPHILRHSGAVLHLINGGDLESLRQDLGHTKITMTAHYAELARVNVRQKHQEVNSLGRLLDQGGGETGGQAVDELADFRAAGAVVTIHKGIKPKKKAVAAGKQASLFQTL